MEKGKKGKRDKGKKKKGRFMGIGGEAFDSETKGYTHGDYFNGCRADQSCIYFSVFYPF